MLTLLKNWPEDGCIRQGVTNYRREMLSFFMDKGPSYGFSHYWSLGNPTRFLVNIYDFWGKTTGRAYSEAEVLFKDERGELHKVADMTLENPNDILGVVDVLSNRYSADDSTEATVWRESMRDFESELTKAKSGKVNYSDCRFDERDNGILPDYMQEILDDWRYAAIGDDTPLPLLEAYIRFSRAWEAWYAISGDMFGSVYNEQLKRTDELAFIIDRRLHKDISTDEKARLMGLYRLLMPSFYSSNVQFETKKEIEYERKWNKWVAEDIVRKKSALNFTKTKLLLRARKDNKRLPAEVTAYIKTMIPAFIKESRPASDIDPYDNTDTYVDACISWLDIYLQWSGINSKGVCKATPEATEMFGRIVSNIDKVNNVDVLYRFNHLILTKCDGYVREEDKAKFYDRVEGLIKDIVRTRDCQPSAIMNPGTRQQAITALAYEFTLGAISLASKFYDERGEDIYTSFRNDYEVSMLEDEEWKAGRFDSSFFDIW